MESEYNVWRPLNVEDVLIGDYMHVYQKEVKDKVTGLGKFGKLVQENVVSITEYYVIGLRSEHIGVFVPQLVIEKEPFERLYNSSFTRIVDYFVMARNCIGVFPCDGSIMDFQAKRSEAPGYDADDDENVRFYSFHDKDHNIQFDFVIDFSLQ